MAWGSRSFSWFSSISGNSGNSEILFRFKSFRKSFVVTYKAGLPGTTNRPYTFHIALRVHPTRNTLYTQTNFATGQVIFGLRHTVTPHKALKPISSTLTPNPYWTIPGTNVNL